MPAYIIATITVTDPQGYEEYRAKVPAVIAAHGGSYVSRGSKVTVLEGDLAPQRVVILEFPDMPRLQAFFESADYAPLRAIRERCAVSSLIAVEGYVP